jgi:hypothetical protein
MPPCCEARRQISVCKSMMCVLHWLAKAPGVVYLPMRVLVFVGHVESALRGNSPDNLSGNVRPRHGAQSSTTSHDGR